MSNDSFPSTYPTDHPKTPDECNVLLRIDTPSHDHDYRDPHRFPALIQEWSFHRSMRDALAYLVHALDPQGQVCQVVSIEALTADDPRRFVDWSAHDAASHELHGY